MPPLKPFFDEDAYRAYLRTLVTTRRRIVYATEFNAAGTHLAAGNSAGHINLFSLESAARDFAALPVLDAQAVPRVPDAEAARQKAGGALRQVDVPRCGAVYSLYTDDECLFCGTENGIVMYKWEHLLDDDASQHQPTVQCTIQAPGGRRLEIDDPIEVNAIAGVKRSCVFAATGDGTVYCYTSDRSSFIGKFSGGGPGAYLHCITMCGEREENSFMSGGDDGVVRLYDRRAGDAPQRFFHMRKLTAATQHSWVGCITTDADGTFMVCGDGNRNLTTVHVASGQVLATSNLDFVPNALVHRGGELFCGGGDRLTQEGDESGKLYRFNLQCHAIGSSEVSASGVYALASHAPSGCMAAAGYSTRGRWHDAAELIDVYVRPPVRSFHMTA
jgi:WD40 repeat protein